MELGEDGKYYLDLAHKKELDGDLVKKIIINLTENKKTNIHIEQIEGKNYYFEQQAARTYIYTEPNNKTEISNSPIEIEFKTKNKTEKRYIFSLSQYKQTLQYFGFSFPWSNDLVLSESNLEILIYHNSILINQEIIIEEAGIFEKDIFNENENENKTSQDISNNIKKLEDLSIYIEYYIKNNLDIIKYEEKDFINENDYKISSSSEFIIFDLWARMNFITHLEDNIQKEYFFTGPYSIGKTFTLLLLANYNIKNKRKAYFNLETLKTNKNYFEIIAYETRHLFDTKETWKKLFISIQENDIKEPLSIINYLIKEFSQKKDKKYFFILDQIKFKSLDEDDIEYQKIKTIRESIKNSENCILIGCCSINYKGVKDLLFAQWFSIKFDKTKDIYLNYIYSFKKTKNDYDDNKYLKMLGNLYRYINIKNVLNKKILNILTKKIKEKIEKFYNKDKLLSLSDLDKIEVNKSFNDNNGFKLFLEKIPFKYFIIYIKNHCIDFAYPLVKKAIKELIDSYEIENFKGNNEAERGWNFERKVIDKIKTSHVFGKYYIDNYVEIPTIYRKYKIKDELFSNSENTLFYFTFMNARRYDCAIYLYDLKALILNKISIKKTRKQLQKYSKENINKDLNDIQKFLKINNIEVKKYYILFILDEDNYTQKENYELIESFYLKYCLFNYKKNIFTTAVENFNSINYLNKGELDINIEDGKLYEFGIYNNSFIYDNDLNEIKSFKFYSEKGMTLKDFLEQIFGEDNYERFHEVFKYNEDKYYLIKTTTLFEKEYRIIGTELFDAKSTVFLNLSGGVLYIGIGKNNEEKIKFSFMTLDHFTFFNQVDNNIKIPFMTGFLFKSTEITQFYK